MAEEAKKDAIPAADQAPEQPTVHWDDTDMRSSYSNVCNVSSTREEVVLVFGVNQAWQGQKDVRIQLTDRVILSPFAAKRLSMLLGQVLGQYESRFGELDVPAGGKSN